MQATKIRYSPILFLCVFYETIKYIKGHSFYQISNQFLFDFKIKLTKAEYNCTTKKQCISEIEST